MPSSAPNNWSALFAPLESNLYSPVSLPSRSLTGSACMQRSTTDINRSITQARSKPVFKIALFDAMCDNWAMRFITAPFVFSHPLTVSNFCFRLAAFIASRTSIPIARARQYASCSGER